MKGITAFVCFLISINNLSAAADYAGGQLSLLVYNTHGLPALLAGDDPKARFPAIAKLTDSYALSLLQEDFAHHDLLVTHLNEPANVIRGVDAGFPKCWLCSSSGLTVISRLSKSGWRVRTAFQPFTTCSGWFTRLNDCFAQKGFQLSAVENAAGKLVYVVNTHLDAGTSADDRTARSAQLKQIAKAIEATAKDKALIFAGDLNLNWDDTEDHALLQSFAASLDLILAQKGGEASSGWKILDYIYFRSGDSADLTLLHAGEDKAFANNDGTLSDHPALFARFAIQ